MNTNITVKKRFAAALAVLSVCVLLLVGTGCYVRLSGPVFVVEDKKTYECYFGFSGGSKVIPVTSDCSFWRIEDHAGTSDSWVSVTKSGDGLLVTVKPSDVPRTKQIMVYGMTDEAGLTVAGTTLTVRQTEEKSPLNLSSYEQEFPQSGGETTVTVSSKTGWSVEKSNKLAMWYSITRSDAGFTVTVGENDKGRNRTAKVIVSNKDETKTFVITQKK